VTAAARRRRASRAGNPGRGIPSPLSLPPLRPDDIADVAGVIRDAAPTGVDLHGHTRDHIARPGSQN
jgi:hypothetical protein